MGDSIQRSVASVVDNGVVVIILHDISIFARIFVILAQYLGGAEAEDSKEKLGVEGRFADVNRDPSPSMVRQLADELGDHLAADALSPRVGMDGEIEHVQSGSCAVRRS